MRLPDAPSHSRHLMPAIFLAALILTSACSSDAPAGPVATVRDSAGITIVENADLELADGGGFSLTSEPLVQIGTLNGPEETQLYGVRGASRLSDGRIALVNSQAPDLRIFGSDGEYLATHGRKGEGPGEFQTPSLVGLLPGDTIVVVDWRLKAIDLFHPDEGFIEGAIATPELQGFLIPAGMFADGTVISLQMLQGDFKEGFARRPVHYRSVGRDGNLRTDFGEFPGDETVLKARTEGDAMFMTVASVPFGKGAKRAVGPHVFYYGSQDTYEIRAIDQDGTLTRLIRLDRPVMEVLPEHVEADISLSLEMAETEDQARTIRQNRQDMPVPGVHPAYGEIYADVLGWLWVEDYRLPGNDVPTFTIFDGEGRLAGSITLPEGLRVLEIGEDYLIGLLRDELEVEHVAVYGLTRPGRS